MGHTLVIFALLASSAYAAFPPAQRADIGQGESKVAFLAVGKPSAIKIRGEVKESAGQRPVAGELTLRGTTLSGTVNVRLDSFDTGIELRNRHMKEKYLQTQTYPAATLEVTKLELPQARTPVETVDAEKIPFEGDLLLHGMKKHVVGLADVKKQPGKLSLALEFAITLNDFGIETPSFMGIKVTDEVKVSAAVAAPTRVID